MSLPTVSVLIPVRNGAAHLRSALASVRAQRLRDWEAVVVDDGSTDDSPHIVEALHDPRVRLLRLPARGIVPALNEGLAACRAPLVARFDADDHMHKDRLLLQVAALNEDPSLDGVSSQIRCFPRLPLRDGMKRYEGWLNEVLDPESIAAQRFIESPLVHPAVTLRRESLLRAGGWRDSAWAEDWDLWLRLFESGARLRKLSRVLHFWRDHPTRLTRQDPRYSAERFMEARAHFLERGPLKNRSAVIWGAGPVGKALLLALDRVGVRVDALIDVDARKIGQLVHRRRVLPMEAVHRIKPAVLLAAVGAEGARAQIRATAIAAGFREGADFFACA